jgi:hypothetical protein
MLGLSQKIRLPAKGRQVSLLIEVLRPLVLLVAIILRLIYRVLFSWWVNPLLDRQFRRSFAEEIRLAMPFLFDLYGGRIVSDPNARANDPHMGYVCIATAGLVFKFRRWRDESYGVQIAPSFAHTQFYDLLEALRLVDPAPDTKLPLLDISWHPWGKLLEPRFLLLEKAFGEQRFGDTKAKLDKSVSLGGGPKAAL